MKVGTAERGRDPAVADRSSCLASHGPMADGASYAQDRAVHTSSSLVPGTASCLVEHSSTKTDWSDGGITGGYTVSNVEQVPHRKADERTSLLEWVLVAARASPTCRRRPPWEHPGPAANLPFPHLPPPRSFTRSFSGRVGTMRSPDAGRSAGPPMPTPPECCPDVATPAWGSSRATEGACCPCSRLVSSPPAVFLRQRRSRHRATL